MMNVKPGWGNPQLIYFHLLCIHPSSSGSPSVCVSGQLGGSRTRLNKSIKYKWDMSACRDSLSLTCWDFRFRCLADVFKRVKPLCPWNAHVSQSNSLITVEILFSPIKLLIYTFDVHLSVNTARWSLTAAAPHRLDKSCKRDVRPRAHSKEKIQREVNEGKKKQDDSLAAWQTTSAGVQHAVGLQKTILFFNRVDLKINQGEWRKSSWRW